MFKKWFMRTLLLVTAGAIFIMVYFSTAISATVFADHGRYLIKGGDPLLNSTKEYEKPAEENDAKTDILPGKDLEPTPSVTTDPNSYIVKSGDSMSSIAQAYNTTVSELKWANSLDSDTVTPGMVLKIPAKQVKSLGDIIKEKGLNIQSTGITIIVDKSDHVLGIFSQDAFLKSYHVELGDGGTGDKEVEEDHKTPEGTFYISEHSVLSPSDEYLGSRWMRLSYPNIEDAKRGLEQGLIGKQTYDAIVTAINNGETPPQDTALGGGVGIHGGSIPEFGNNWTWGCIGLTNSDVEDFYTFVHTGTKVVIQR